jgi:hypothetical protein
MPINFFDHCQKFPERGHEAMALVEKNGAAARKRKGHALTHCKRGHPIAGANLGYKKYTNCCFYRCCIACHNYHSQHGAEMKPAKSGQPLKLDLRGP